MVKIKICGLRRLEDVELVNQVKVDYAGFVLAPSPRQVTLEDLKSLTEKLDGGIKSVAVVVNEEVDFLVELMSARRIWALQLHGDESPALVSELQRRLGKILKPGTWEVWKALRVGDKLPDMKVWGQADRLLLDSCQPGFYGGSGKRFAWDKIPSNSSKPLILAGGLGADSVNELLENHRPWGIDVSSSLETDGFKDPEKVLDFVCRTRQYQKKQKV